MTESWPTWGHPLDRAHPFHPSYADPDAAGKALDRDPAPPPRDVIAPVEGRVLDPATAMAIPGVRPRPTVYVGSRLLTSRAIDFDDAVRVLRAVAEPLGWSVEPDEQDPRTAGLRSGVRGVRLGIASKRATAAPDAWTLLQQTRRQFGLDAVRGIALDHVIFARPPEASSPPLPVAYVGPAPIRTPDAKMATRRPVVAILDTGCGEHPWLDDVVTRGVTLDGLAIGHETSNDPGSYGELPGDLDRMIDPLFGQGTFIAGLVHQGCPDAEILSWRGVPLVGPVIESDWIASLAQLAELVRRFRAGESGGRAIDVLSLSMGYYHETPQVPLFDPTLYEVLNDLARNGTLVVCSAGDDATSRLTFPAAFAPWADGAGPIPAEPNVPPIVSVGALRPNGVTNAPFSNTGPWVRAYVPGSALMSTFPVFQGGPQPMAPSVALGQERQAIDADDFRAGFGVWSGSSFAAPLMAARLADRVQRDLESGDDAASAVARAWSAIEELTSITR